ncbi:Pre-mRNA-splicing factor cef1 [Blastocladiella emersonii ATCC 22665]|nr:Pre-mRNA-splicing factor cef1 [Blastocladiella emersonii ATCC 22665]
MRVVIKGGVWKNTEDEILKVAVMKYGKNQWARISSLLTRKTPKQCKARWYEWLDPSIKKTEWSKTEDEKLLHLAKLMPTQWRTIAPIVGRTPAQCLERYQRLLDDAERELTGEAAAADGIDVDAGPSSDDVRRLRPGEIDPDPETKPARPDPVDMDEDEKEMLSEARARLANTQGKKAKRKARERQLEESRRLATLQKRRELKASGINLGNRKARGDEVDYIKDTPFQRAPLPGFYDATDELNKKNGQAFGEVLLARLEGKRKAEREESDRKRDAKKRKTNEESGISFIAAGAKVASIFEADAVSAKRGPLNLPAPQITEQEVAELAKAGATGPLLPAGADSDLLTEYSATPRAPLRTPRMAVVDSVRQHARAIVQDKTLQTPLLGEEQDHIDHSLPRATTILPPSQTPGGAVPDTPRSSIVPGTPHTSASATPYRDRMGINTPRDTPFETPREQRMRALQSRSHLKQALLALPKPKNDFQIVLPDAAPAKSDAELASRARADRSDLDAAAAADAEAQRRERDAMRSQVLQRQLPRPRAIPTLDALLAGSLYTPGSALHTAERLIAEEVIRLVAVDAIESPVPGLDISGAAAAANDSDDISFAQLSAARTLVDEECGEVPDSGFDLPTLLLRASIAPVASDLVLDPSTGAAVSRAALAASGDWPRVLTAMTAEVAGAAARADKIEKKCRVTTAGYAVRAKSLAASLTRATEDLERQARDLESVRTLRDAETRAIPLRIAEAEAEAEAARREQAELQARYAEVARALAELGQ